MAIADDKSSPSSDGKVWGLFRLPFRNSQPATSSSTNFAHYQQNYGHGNNNNHLQVDGSGAQGNSVSSVARSLLPARRRLKLDPSKKLYFTCTDELLSVSCCSISWFFFSFFVMILFLSILSMFLFLHLLNIIAEIILFIDFNQAWSMHILTDGIYLIGWSHTCLVFNC